jgi:hypothetical protein
MSKMSDFMKFISGKKILIFSIVFILALGIFAYSKTKNNIITKKENFSALPTNGNGNISSTPAQITPSTTQYRQNVANPSDLLPQDINSQWTTLNPTMTSNNVIVPDLLDAGYHIGLDTIGQTLRNANLQERSDPIIAKQDVSPWNNSTIEPNIGQVPFEIGYGCR